MRGAQGPGDARGERPIVRDRAPSRRVYTMRRLLAALILLILLALLVPLACQALLGSEDEGQRADRGDGTSGKAAGVASDTEDAAEEADTRDNPTDAGAAETARDAGSEQAREDSEEQNYGAASELGEILTENLAVVVTEPAEPGDDKDVSSDDASADRTAQSMSDSGDEWRVDRLASISQQKRPVTRSSSTDRQPSAGRRAPAERPATDSSNAAVAVERPPPEPATATVASAPGPVLELDPKPIPEPVSVPVVESAPVPMFVQVRPVAAIRPVHVPVVRGTPGRRGASIAANAVNAATNFGGGVAGARGNNGAAFPRAGAVRGASALAGRSVF